MLREHLKNLEQELLVLSKKAGIASHSVNKGTAREIFVRKFLQEHLSERVSVGTGEIITSKSTSREKRNQMDVVLYRPEYPRLPFAGHLQLFLAESVVATIEIKTKLTKDELLNSSRAAKRTKSLQRCFVRSMHIGYQPPAILNFVVAYDGPRKMVHPGFPGNAARILRKK